MPAFQHSGLYIAASEVLGAITATGVLYFIAGGQAGFDVSGGLASNGYEDHSPGEQPLGSGLEREKRALVFIGTFRF